MDLVEDTPVLITWVRTVAGCMRNMFFYYGYNHRETIPFYNLAFNGDLHSMGVAGVVLGAENQKTVYQYAYHLRIQSSR